MLGIPGDLADVIEVVRYGFQGDPRIVLGLVIPQGRQHPVVKGDTHHPTAIDDGLNLTIIELPVMVAQSAAAIVRCQHLSAKDLQGFPESGRRQMT